MSFLDTVIENDKNNLKLLQNSPHYLKLTQLEPKLTTEEMTWEIFNNKVHNQNNLLNNNIHETFNFNLTGFQNTFIYKNILPMKTFLNASGVSSAQTYINTPTSFKELKNDLVECKILDMMDQNWDAITNIRVTKDYSNNFPIIMYPSEFVLKFNGNVIESNTVLNDNTINLITFPNVILNNSLPPYNPNIQSSYKYMTPANISIWVRNTTKVKFSYKIEYDIILLDKGRKQILETDDYMCITPSGLLIKFFNNRAAIRKYTCLMDTVSPIFKTLYGKEKYEDEEDENQEQEEKININENKVVQVNNVQQEQEEDNIIISI